MGDPLIDGGYILLSRKIIKSEIFKKPPLYLKVWVYLLASAQYKAYKRLDKGQLFTSIPEIQEACSYMVGFRKEVPSKDQIYNVLEWLRNPHEGGNESNTKAKQTATMTATSITTMITTTKATHGMLVNIDKYGIYQDSKNYESNDEDRNESNDESSDECQDESGTKAERKQRQADNINKNDKNIKNERIKYIVGYLNEKAGTNYRSSTVPTQKHINARLTEGYTEEDFKAVIDCKITEWKGTEMEKYLRPETLFGSKFEGYLNQAGGKNGSQSGPKKIGDNIFEV